MDMAKRAEFSKREVPQIAGSASAFIALVVILVLIIIASCTAVVILLREERRNQDVETLSQGNRDLYEVSKPRSDPQTSRKWYTRVLDLSGSGNRSKEHISDKPKSKSKRRSRGWLQAANSSEGDSDSEVEPASPKQWGGSVPSTPLRMKGQKSSPSTKRSSTGGTLPYKSRPYSAASDMSSTSIRFDPHGVRGLQYPDLYAPSPQRTVPGIHSQLYSPSTSPSSTSVHQSKPMFSTSPIPFEELPRQNSVHSANARPFSAHSGPSVRTFESGSKFIEAL